MKLWQKNTQNTKEVEAFTIGNDPEYDLLLAPYDVMGSLAHTKMLAKIGLLTENELSQVTKALLEIFDEVLQGKFEIEEGVEDVHSQIELLLTRRIGDAGKKIHSGRSRNDQVLVDLKLYFRAELETIAYKTQKLFALLLKLAAQHRNDMLPGYTHTQLAMPSSFGLWFSAYAESLAEDMDLLGTAYRLANRNPLGSGAGYGSSFPLDRKYTTELLGFEGLHYNVVNAQLSRGKTEKTIAFALAGMGATLNKLASDVCLYMNQNFGFITFPDALTTGSSIMPHKKNPDVFELIRAKTNQLQGLPQEITLLLTNLTSGYHRDLQLVKEAIFPGIITIKDCLDMTHFMLEHIIVKKDILKDAQYKLLFSVEEVNRLVLEGVPFRDAYKQVGLAIEAGTFEAPAATHHSHEGSIGNLCLDEIRAYMDANVAKLPLKQVEERLAALLGKAG